MIARADNPRKIIKLREDVFLCWLEPFCGKYSNLVVNSFRNKISRVTLSAAKTTKKVIAPILKVEKTVRNKVAQACDS
jgi:hypothetical protein